jgi:hypothetical protein
VNRKQFLLAALVAACSGLGLYLFLTAEHDVPLVPVEDAPRAPVSPRGDSPHLTLSGLGQPPDLAGNELRRHRNRLAEEHRARLAAWRDGRATSREVEAVEMELWVARAAVGEISQKEMHAQLAALFERERERLVLLQAKSLAGPDEVARARLYVARERHRAGLPIEDPEGRDYETMRRAYLESVKKRHTSLIEQGAGNREHLAQEYEGLVDEFPPEREQTNAGSTLEG